MLSNRTGSSKATDGTVVGAMTVPFLKDWLPGVLFILFLFLILQFFIGRIYGFIIFPDEFGYWAAAAKWKGYDWSGVSSLGSYYSFGYGFLLYPLLSVIQNPVTLYRSGLYLNLLLLGAAFILLYYILKKLFVEKDRKQLVYIAMSGIMYSSWIFYMQMTLSEILVVSLYLLIIFLFQFYLEKPKVLSAFLLAGAFVYLYFVHMRSVATLAAGVAVLVLQFLTHKKYRKSMMVFCLTAGMLLLAGSLMKKDIVQDIYSGMQESVLKVNDYRGQWDKIINLFTGRDLMAFLKSCMGKLFYLGISTFGLFYWGFAFLIKRVKVFFREKGNSNPLYLFLFLSVVGQFLVSALFMVKGDRADLLIYGRYNEVFLPVLLCLGLIEMLHSSGIIKKTVLLLSGQIVLTAIVILIWKWDNLPFSHACFIIGVNYAIDRFQFNPVLSGCVLAIAGLLLFMLTAILIRIIKKNNSRSWLLCGIMLLQILIGLKACNDYIILHNQLNYQDVMLGTELKDLADEGREVYFSVTKESAQYIDLLQFGLGKVPIRLIAEGKMKAVEYRPEAVIITYKNNQNKDTLEKNYEETLESNHFYIYYNPQPDNRTES